MVNNCRGKKMDKCVKTRGCKYTAGKKRKYCRKTRNKKVMKGGMEFTFGKKTPEKKITIIKQNISRQLSTLFHNGEANTVYTTGHVVSLNDKQSPINDKMETHEFIDKTYDVITELLQFYEPTFDKEQMTEHTKFIEKKISMMTKVNEIYLQLIELINESQKNTQSTSNNEVVQI